jgi:hypothetical protein
MHCSKKWQASEPAGRCLWDNEQEQDFAPALIGCWI